MTIFYFTRKTGLKADKRQGFTLIELSIVLVIIGIISGGILVGSTLIRSSEIRKMHRQFEEYITAVNTFQEKYHCLPGDCATAEDLFTPDVVCPPPNDSPVKNAVCNGNGDGQINASVTGNETLELWRHLAAAQLTPGSFSGAYSTFDTISYAQDYNCPAVISPSASISCWFFYSITGAGGTTIPIIDGNYGTNVLLMIITKVDVTALAPLFTRLQHFMPVSDAQALGLLFQQQQLGVLTPVEALQYDSKYDDGRPVGGAILALSDIFYVTGCTTTQDASSQYDLTKPGRNCGFFYKTNF